MEKFFEHDIELVLTGHVHSRDIATTYNGNLRKSLILLLKGYLNFDKVINSIVNDTTAYGESDKQDQTDDIETTIKLKRVAAN